MRLVRIAVLLVILLYKITGYLHVHGSYLWREKYFLKYDMSSSIIASFENQTKHYPCIGFKYRYTMSYTLNKNKRISQADTSFVIDGTYILIFVYRAMEHISFTIEFHNF